MTQGTADIHVELDGCTLHVDVSHSSAGPGIAAATDYILRAVDLTDADAFADAFGAVVLTSDDALAWWDAHPDRLKQEVDWWLDDRAPEPWDV